MAKWSKEPCTIPEFVAHLQAITPSYGGVRVHPEEVHPVHGPGRRVSFVTGGWPECERLQARLERTLFHLLCWESTHRGGLTEYFITDYWWNRKEPHTWGEKLGKGEAA